MFRGECCGHLDAWPVGSGLAGGGLARRLGCAAPWPALALCVAERAGFPRELGDLVRGRRARGRSSCDEAAAPGGSVTDHHRRAGGYRFELTTAAAAPSPRMAGATDSPSSLALSHPARVVAVGTSGGRDGGTPFWTPGLVRRFRDRSGHLRRSAACAWDQGQIVPKSGLGQRPRARHASTALATPTSAGMPTPGQHHDDNELQLPNR